MPVDPIELGGIVDRLVGERFAAGSNDVFREVIQPIERLVIESVKRRLRGNVVKSSRVLGLARMTIRKKLMVPK